MTFSLPIRWRYGTAFDFFISQQVLYNPEYFGLRSSWASGMRQRLPKNERELLGEFGASIGHVPHLEWLLSLPQPVDSKTALEEIKKLTPVNQVMVFLDFKGEIREVLKEVVVAGKWGDHELDLMLNYYKNIMKYPTTKLKCKKYLDNLTKSQEIVTGVFDSLVTYYEMFFEEEEGRIVSALKIGLEKAQEKARKRDFITLLEEFTGGVQLTEPYLRGAKSITLIPSFWIAPRIMQDFGANHKLVFGVRDDETSLIPGEIVPDALVSGLDSLSNTTRLKILRYINKERLTATQISRKLRLRPPTVAHHLKSLRIAGLVTIHSNENQKEVFYSAREDQIKRMITLLDKFISPQ